MQIWKKIPVGVMAEIINNVLYVTPNPALDHQEVAGTLSAALFNYVREKGLGTVYSRPIDVFLDNNKAVVTPDINYISNGNLHKIDKKAIRGAPDLLIEVHSPLTGRRDRTIKKNLYEKMGVKEYWIVHPVTKKAEGYLLEDRRYQQPLELTSRIDVRILNKSFDF